MGKIERFAPAKVNLSLEVTGRRANGYHELQSLVVFARDVGDHLSFSHAKELSIQIDGPFAFGLTAGDENLVLRAAHTLQKSLGLSEGAKVILTKNLPIASGIGGGSADAAATLLGLTALWRQDVPLSLLTDIGLGLGADVPMCLSGKAAWITGIGEKISPLPNFPSFWALLVNPLEPLSTPAVFDAYSNGNGFDYKSVKSAPRRLDPASVLSWLEAAENDLEASACKLSKELAKLLTDLRARRGCLLGRMSGSGATCFGLFKDEKSARSAAEYFSGQHSDWWLQVTQLGSASHHY